MARAAQFWEHFASYLPREVIVASQSDLTGQREALFNPSAQSR